ncbi:MAG: ATP-binding protein [Gemmatimonadota bacterium]|nr:ATP-binding protein [Gemmatimonadota bacterium]
MTDVASAVVGSATTTFDASGVVLVRLVTDDTLEIVAAGDMPATAALEWQRFPLATSAPLADAVRTGEPVFLESRDGWRQRYPDLLPVVDAAGHQANAVVPLVVEGRPIGAMGIAFRHPTVLGDEERDLIATVARQCALALERARLHEERGVLLESERRARTEAEAARAIAEDARAEAEQANRAKSEFLAIMSHELRTPLNAIAGYVELLELGIRGPVTAEQIDDLQRIKQAQRHLTGLIGHVLNYVRVETGRVDYDLKSIAVNNHLLAIEGLIAPQVAAKRLAYSYEPCEPSPIVLADPEKLDQILLNLLTNAIKFTDAGRVWLDCELRGFDVLIRVHDTGAGIPPGRLDDIFEPFIQVNRGFAAGNEGVGLGLAISRDLARGMGGGLTVESELGTGSTFTLTLRRGDEH